MSGTGRTRAVLALPRAVVGFLGFTALTAVIVGILAMHVWMGGHGSTAAHGMSALSGTAHSQHAGHDSSAPAQADNSDAPLHGADGCGGSCEEGAVAAGLCVLAFIVAALLAFLLPAGRLVPGSVLLRGPPLIYLRPQSIPAPSLIRLCISRT